MTKARDLAGIANGIADADIASLTAEAVDFTQTGTGAVQRTVESKLNDVVSVTDFGAVGDGTTDDTDAIQAALDAAGAAGSALIAPGGLTFLISSELTINNTEDSVPAVVDFNNSTIQADTDFTDDQLLYVQNPHGDVRGFTLKNVVLDCNSLADHGLYIKGSQNAYYKNIRVISATSHGFLIQGESGFGIYHNLFEGCDAGASSDGNGGYGFYVRGVTQRFANDNTFTTCASRYNTSGGYYFERCSGNTMVGCDAEANSGAGITIAEGAAGISILGGYSENNEVSTADTWLDFSSTTDVSKIQAIGGRHNGTVAGTTTIDGCFFSNTSGDTLTYNGVLTLGASGDNQITAAASSIRFGKNIAPLTDNNISCGVGSFRWSVVYAGTGTINTSDERAKQDIAALDAAELRVAAALKGLVKKFRFKDAVQTKGDDARIHVGVIAQEVIAAFQAEGLDPMRYGIVCYDQWDAELDDEGNEITPAGDRYGIRYEELLAFIIAAL